MKDLHEYITTSHSDVQFGVVNVALKKYGGKIVTVDTNKVINYKTDKGNVEGLNVITTILKGVSESIKQKPEEPTPPTVTFTVYYDRRGDMRQVSVNSFNRTQLDKK